MAFSQQGSVGTASRPSTDTAVAEIPRDIVDEEKPPIDLNNNQPQSDHEDQQHSQDILNTAWGKHGKTYMWIGQLANVQNSELDHATIYNYQNYAASDFRQIALLGALMTAGTIISAVLKPPIARISDVAGRAETYVAVVIFYIISYILCASAKSFAQYAGGYVIYCIGQTGMQILNQVIVADITSSRWRGLANGLVNLPFMIIPWVSAFIVDSVLANIGWRWGIGMFSIILPTTSVAVIIPLIWFQHRVKKAGGTVRKEISVAGFLTQIDLGGMVLLCGGCAMLLLPIALAGNTADGWRTPWVPALIVLGVLSLLGLVYYEGRVAVKPVIPPRFVRNISLVLAFLIGLLDAFAYSITHTYMYAWATVVHDFSARNATFLTYTAGCVQVLTGLGTGFVMYRTKRYKFLLLLGIIVRLIGYGFMMRLRGANNSTAEIFIMQVIQGAGSGAVGTIVIVVAQVVVPREELAQATALELLFIYLGNSLGSAIAGTIYTSLFKERLRHWMEPSTAAATIDAVYDKITGGLPDPGTSERMAVNHAYSDILRYMTIAALVASTLPMIMIWFLPNLKLSDNHNLSKNLTDEQRPKRPGRGKNETWLQKWQRRARW
ncbi:uncharacterized protein A1O9_01805 [Exophiala aquamarina CBS 119918]|uniref:Major facilitator superfamily (MFS) profile domain-containing protein n=1 Tax=Exophiala aquamarina CBS 119918 TaxID=1182545 RepID=A0A072PVT6_9EURO|nr:uncharacterized protein A1O9_01805 [Exophiala aquamarina CBS 119918]KEF63827.1 hypothetical protein A1O9_01805 [Exophiala aquamarina CBS 119918]